MPIDLGQLFGEESAFRQLFIWSVGAQIVSALMGPGLAELTQQLNELVQTTPLTPELCADLVVRGFLDKGSAALVASRSGVNGGDFDLMVRGSGAAPDTTQLVEAYRRGLIPLNSGNPDVPSLVTGIQEGRVANKWIPMLEGLGQVPIGVADAVDGVVEGQITMAQGQAIGYKNGLAPDDFQILYNIRGNPPSPTQLTEMVHRGVIGVHGTGPDATTFQQGISEGATKDKWEPLFEAIMEVLPPARTVTALQRSGTITSDQALAYYKQLGLGQETAAAYVQDASHGKSATARHLAVGTITKLYTDQVIDRSAASGMMTALGYEAHEADLELALADLHASLAAEAKAVSKVSTLYIARKISKATAVTLLDDLGVPTSQRDVLLKTWDLEKAASVRILTPAEVESAVYYEIMTFAQGQAELVAMGYTQYDAWVKLSIRMKQAQPDQPPGQPSPEDRV